MMGILSLLVIGTGIATLSKGRLGYYNYKRLIVFAPFAIVVGACFLLVTFVKWKSSRSVENCCGNVADDLKPSG